ncbi:hypothetical protein FGO68_gene11958 [Halteria grandinella]|uniref:Uncharacterized protein n=1 Tax=Halteria grandinella TaxID=5974 RepID=A0A8J8NH15_HALGN|nr:hypothetical protein FGO68_gene11958 [Halteria grandinella]
MSSLIMIPVMNSSNEPFRYNINVKESAFSRFTNCGSLLSNHHHSDYYLFPPTFNSNFLLPQYQGYGEHLQRANNQFIQRRYMSHLPLQWNETFEQSPFSKYNSQLNFTRLVRIADNTFDQFNMLKKRHNDNNYTVRNSKDYTKVSNESMRDIGFIVQLYDNFDSSYLAIEGNRFSDTQQEYISETANSPRHCQTVIPLIIPVYSQDIYANLSEPIVQMAHLISAKEFRNSLFLITNNTFTNLSLAGPLIHLQERPGGLESAMIIAKNTFSFIHGLINTNIVNIKRDSDATDQPLLIQDVRQPQFSNLISTIALVYTFSQNMYGGNILIAWNNFTQICGCREVDASAISVGVKKFQYSSNFPVSLKRNVVIPYLDPTIVFQYPYLSLSDLFLPVSITHPSIGQLTLLRMGVNITGNIFTNVSIGSERLQDLFQYIKSGITKIQNVAHVSISQERFQNCGSQWAEHSNYLFNLIHYKTSSVSADKTYNQAAPTFKSTSTFFATSSSAVLTILTAARIELGSGNYFNNVWLVDRTDAMTRYKEQATILFVNSLNGNLTIGGEEESVIENVQGYLNNQTLDQNGVYSYQPELSSKSALVAQYGIGAPLFNFIKVNNTVQNVILKNIVMRNMYFASNVTYPSGESSRVPAIFTSDMQDKTFLNVLQSITLRNVLIENTQYDGTCRYIDLLAWNITIENLTMRNIGHIDLASDSRLRALVMRDRVGMVYRESVSLFKVTLMSKDSQASQVRVNELILSGINATRGALPVFIIDRPWDQAPAIESKIQISDLTVKGDYYQEETVSQLWGSNLPSTALFKISNSKELAIQIEVTRCQLNWLYSTYGLLQTQFQIDALRLSGCKIQQFGAQYAAIQYLPAGTIREFSIDQSKIYGDTRYILDKSDFLSVATHRPELFIRGSLFKIISVSNVTFANSIFQGNHFAKQGGLIDIRQGSNLYLKNVQVTQLSASQAGAIMLTSDSFGYISNSTFHDLLAINHGVILLNMESALTIKASNFYANKAMQNGVFKVSGDSDMEIEGCSFKSNFAENYNSVGSVYQVKNYFKIKNSIFEENEAFISDQMSENQVGRLIEFIAILAQIELTGCQFLNNLAHSGTPNLYFFYSTNVLILSCHFSINFDQSQQSPEINGNFLQIISRTQMKISKCTFTNGFAISGGAIYVQGEAHLEISQSTFSGNNAQKYGGAIYGDSLKYLRISENCLFIDNYAKIFNGDALQMTNFPTGAVEIEDTDFKSTYLPSNFVHIEEVFTAYIQGITAINVNSGSKTSDKQAGFILKNINNATIAKSSFINLYGSNPSGGGGAIVIEQTDKNQAKPTEIIDCDIIGSRSSTHGGGLALINTYNVFVSSTKFINNEAALNGGALHYSCNSTGTLNYPCQVLLSGCTFVNNTAGKEGGAIKWNFYEPQYINVLFENNRAGYYGNDVASVAKELIQISKENIGKSAYNRSLPIVNSQYENVTMQSGGTVSFYFGLIDKNGSFIKTDNKSSLIIQILRNTSEEFTAVIETETQIQSRNGIFSIENMILIATPNTTQQIKFETDGVNLDIPQNQPSPMFASFGIVTSIESSHSLDFQIFVRGCFPGEQLLSNGVCKSCEAGTYLLVKSGGEPTTCKPCQLQYSYCLGGANVYPRPGYWRSSRLSENFMQCLNPASCLGGLITQDPLGTCGEGYQGILCSSCKSGYSLSESTRKCLKCPTKTANFLLIAGIVVILAVFVIILVSANQNSSNKEKNYLPVFLRILLNHFQVLTLVGTFDFDWPHRILDFYKDMQPVSDAQTQLLSVDCFIDTNRDVLGAALHNESLIQPIYIKSLALAALPLVMIAISIVYWLLKEKIRAFRRKWTVVSINIEQEQDYSSQKDGIDQNVYEGSHQIDLKPHQDSTQSKKPIEYKKQESIQGEDVIGKILSTVIVILFLLHPTLTREMFNMFNCKEIEGVERLYRDLDVVCYRGIHWTIAIGVSLPVIIIFSLGIPIVGFWVIYKNKEDLQKPFFKKRYGFLYSGYGKGGSAYWEIFVIYRKIILIFIQVFLVRLGKIVQALITLLFLCTVMFFTHFLSPYTQHYLNHLELISLFSSTVSVYFCIYFISFNIAENTSNESTSEPTMFALIVIFQTVFFIYWAYCFMREFRYTIRKRFPRLYLVLVLCCRKEKLTLESSVDKYQAKVVAPLLASFDQMQRFIGERKRLYEQGMVPKEDKELRSQVLKFLQFQQKIERHQQFSKDSTSKSIIDSVLSNSKLYDYKSHSIRLSDVAHSSHINNQTEENDEIFQEMFDTTPPLYTRDMSITNSCDADSLNNIAAEYSLGERAVVEQEEKVKLRKGKNSGSMLKKSFQGRSPLQLMPKHRQATFSIANDAVRTHMQSLNETVREQSELESILASVERIDEPVSKETKQFQIKQEGMINQSSVDVQIKRSSLSGIKKAKREQNKQQKLRKINSKKVVENCPSIHQSRSPILMTKWNQEFVQLEVALDTNDDVVGQRHQKRESQIAFRDELLLSSAQK